MAGSIAETVNGAYKTIGHFQSKTVFLRGQLSEIQGVHSRTYRYVRPVDLPVAEIDQNGSRRTAIAETPASPPMAPAIIDTSEL